MNQHFGCENDHAPSCHMEQYYTDLKKKLNKISRKLLRVDKLLKIHLQDIMGDTIRFSSEINKMEMNMANDNWITSCLEKENVECLISNRSDEDLKPKRIGETRLTKTI